ncbi:MAG: glycoside hydrolase family 31 protein [Deltaproteobacteria bacterium]|nr:glycoside hydrolase family 31 protein [Deltaproteobacteria bacterium]
MRKWIIFGLVALGGLACSSGEGIDPRPQAVAGDYGVYFDEEKLELSLERKGAEGADDAVLLRFPSDGLQLGVVDQVRDEVNYDPWPMYSVSELGEYTPPAGLEWLDLISAVASPGTDGTSLSIQFDHARGKTSRLRIEVEDDGRFRLEWMPEEGVSQVAYFRLRPMVDSAEAFYGLGAYLDHVNHRGLVRAMQLEPDFALESSYNEAHDPIPFVIGTRGWGLFAECPFPGLFDMASRTDDRAEIVFGTGPMSSMGFVFHLFGADHPLDLTRHYYEVTGYPKLPAPWALGPWIWRDENEDQAQLLSDIQIIREQDLATSGIWIDRPYASAVNSFDFDPNLFPEPQAMIQAIFDLGFRVALWHTPYLDADDPACAELRAHALANDFFPPEVGLMLNHWSYPIDLTNPAAYAWWQDLIRRYTDLGVEGFKLDYAEDVVPGVFGARNVWGFSDGSDERSMHALYQRFYHRVYAETMPADGGFLICRGATYGDQVNVNVIWPGDLDANMLRHRELGNAGTEDEYVAVGGLPASVIYGLSLGPSGFPFYGADTGGYRHSPPDKECFTRWFQQTALSSVMQVGTSSNDVPWEFQPENGFDEEMLGWYRRYARLHMRLWPYEWTLAKRIALDGRPIQRPLGLQFPELGAHPDDQYMFGDALLVAPVVDRGARSKDVIFPPGAWLDWWTGERIEGGQTITVDAPLDTLPLYQRAGTIVPMLRPSIDSMAPTSRPDLVDSYATSSGRLYARVALGGTAHFDLFDGTTISCEEEDSGLRLSVTPGEAFQQGVHFLITTFGANAPADVQVDGRSLSMRDSLEALEGLDEAWFFEGSALAGSLHLRVGAGAHELSISR